MRTPDRDRCGYRILAVSLALILLVQGAAALDATFVVSENGTWYHGDVVVEGAATYEFSEPGVLGESVPGRSHFPKETTPSGMMHPSVTGN